MENNELNISSKLLANCLINLIKIITPYRHCPKKGEQHQTSIQQLSEKVDTKHTKLTKDIDRMEDKMNFIQHKSLDMMKKFYNYIFLYFRYTLRKSNELLSVHIPSLIHLLNLSICYNNSLAPNSHQDE
ncbi:hypothetical protein [Gracilibacillus saliphilus]|uniref:hypothetical protein n=1 Tax=Gracilibacillus saliphilus TaxID=543890 RepID=UPI0013D8446E|nr:hypothetical protein [Gracilibacillus saliphilus]